MLALRIALLATLGSTAVLAQLHIGGDVEKPLTLTLDDLAHMPRTSVAVDDHGTSITYQGVLLYDVLKRAGAPIDKQLSGKGLASYLLAEARDGYQVVCTLTEIDPAFTDNKLLVADTANGKPLTEEQGPLRLIVPNEKKPARSLRMLERLTVVRLRK